MKIQKVGPKAKRPKNQNNNIPTHPMTMPLKRLVKNTREDISHLVVIIAQLIFKKLPDLVAPKNVVISKYKVF